MGNILAITQLVSAVALIVLVLLQRANPDAGGALSSDAMGGFAMQKRGMEKTLYRATIFVALVFVLSHVVEFFKN